MYLFKFVLIKYVRLSMRTICSFYWHGGSPNSNWIKVFQFQSAAVTIKSDQVKGVTVGTGASLGNSAPRKTVVAEMYSSAVGKHMMILKKRTYI